MTFTNLMQAILTPLTPERPPDQVTQDEALPELNERLDAAIGHPEGCRCGCCLEAWLYMGDGETGPFSEEELGEARRGIEAALKDATERN